MQVYKAFFKIVQKNIPQLVIYVALFLFFAIFLANTYTDPTNINFTETKVNIAFINHDTDSIIVDGLKNHLRENANIVELPDDAQSLQDALFFREVEYIVRVPEGFTKELLEGKEIQLEKTILPGSASSVYMDNLINKYLNTAKLYIGNIKDLTQERLISHIDKDLSQEGEVMMFNPDLEKTRNVKRAYYFNFLAYSLFAVLILGVSSVMVVFNNADRKRRNLCSPLKLRNMNYQMILGNISFAVLAWLIMISASFIMYGSFMFTVKGLLFILNSFTFTLSALSISFLIGNLIKSKNAMSAVSNVASLGTCFISGVFVPQEFLGKDVLKIASFTPTYWYVKSNHAIANTENMKMANLMPIFTNMLIMIGFALTVLAVTLVVIKQRSMGQRDGLGR